MGGLFTSSWQPGNERSIVGRWHVTRNLATGVLSFMADGEVLGCIQCIQVWWERVMARGHRETGREGRNKEEIGRGWRGGNDGRHLGWMEY